MAEPLGAALSAAETVAPAIMALIAEDAAAANFDRDDSVFPLVVASCERAIEQAGRSSAEPVADTVFHIIWPQCEWSDEAFCREVAAKVARALAHPGAGQPAAVAALRFYAENWQSDAEGDFSTPGLSRSWMEPNDTLLSDEGRVAREALSVLEE